MTITLDNLKPAKISKRSRKRLGRGNASGHGTYSGRGIKGQRARSGGKKGLKRKGLRIFLKNVPKKSGFRSLKPKMAIVKLEDLEKKFKAGEIVNNRELVKRNLIKTAKTGVKILGQVKLTKKLTVIADAFSKSAKKSIIKAGGKVELRERKSRGKSKKDKHFKSQSTKSVKNPKSK